MSLDLGYTIYSNTSGMKPVDIIPIAAQLDRYLHDGTVADNVAPLPRGRPKAVDKEPA